jgi:hypothetical protein
MLTDALTSLYGRPARTRRAIALAAACLALLLAAAAIDLAWSVVAGAFSDLQDRRHYLGNLQLITEAAAEITDIKPSEIGDVDGTFLQGTNKEVVGAELQNWFGQAAGEAGVELQTIENIAIATEKKQDYVGLSATLFGPWKSIQNLIFKIETAQPMLFVREVDIQSSYSEEENAEPRVTMRISFFGALRSADAKDGS